MYVTSPIRVVKQVCCSIDRRECMFRECNICLDYRVQFQAKGLLKDESIIIQWEKEKQEYEKKGEKKTTNVIRKSVKRGTLKDLKIKFCESIRNELCKQVFIIRHQFRMYKHLKETVNVNEAILHIDFSENYVCKNFAAIQSSHFGASNKQATLHIGVIYKMDGHQSFTTISDSLRHDPPSIWAHLEPVLIKLKLYNPQITDLHFFSDGPTTQYRNKQNFFLFSAVLYELKFQLASWNFFQSGHGKGAPDAIGGSVKRQADQLVNMGCDLPDAESLYNFLNTGDSLIKFYFIEVSKITSFDSRCSKILKAITGTMKLHQLHTDRELSVLYRNLSCCCKRTTVCTCYNLKRYMFSKSTSMNLNIGESTTLANTKVNDYQFQHLSSNIIDLVNFDENLNILLIEANDVVSDHEFLHINDVW